MCFSSYGVIRFLSKFLDHVCSSCHCRVLLSVFSIGLLWCTLILLSYLCHREFLFFFQLWIIVFLCEADCAGSHGICELAVHLSRYSWLSKIFFFLAGKKSCYCGIFSFICDLWFYLWILLLSLFCMFSTLCIIFLWSVSFLVFLLGVVCAHWICIAMPLLVWRSFLLLLSCWWSCLCHCSRILFPIYAYILKLLLFMVSQSSCVFLYYV